MHKSNRVTRGDNLKGKVERTAAVVGHSDLTGKERKVRRDKRKELKELFMIDVNDAKTIPI